MDYKNILELVTSNIDNGVFIVNKEGNVVFYNEPVNNLAGVTVKNAIGNNILEIFPKLTSQTSTLMRVLKTGKPIRDYIQKYYNYQLKQVTILTTTLPICENNEIVGAIEIFTDIDKIKGINENIKVIENKQGRLTTSELAYYSIKDIIGKNKKMIELKSRILKIANSPSPVLIYGETGTGKELVVQSIHNASDRKDKPFIAQNCAAIPGTLLESILFGTTLGSFTGAKDNPGLFEIADGGTLFLDEINSMDVTLQAKLLRVLQDGIIRRIGGKSIRKVDVRVIAALNVDPNKAITEGKIREDLYFRLNVLNINIPPLRKRKDDINVLTKYFINIYNRKLNKKINYVSNNTEEFFYKYDWPGNVRELQHMIEHAANMTENDTIKLEDLPSYICKHTEDLNNKTDEEYTEIPLKELLKEYEKKIITETLTNNNFNISKTAMLLGIPRQTLHYKLNKLHIKIEKEIKSRNNIR